VELHHEHHVAFALSGTVALPSPFPATGRVFLGIYGNGSEAQGERPPLALKVIQVVTDRFVVTRFVPWGEVRAIRFLATVSDEEGEEEGAEEWTTLTARSFAGTKLFRAAVEQVVAAGGEAEIELLPKAIIYVPESAPVFTRFELGMTAAESAECEAFGAACRLKCAPHAHAETRMTYWPCPGGGG
jgi:hypothetical protein